MNLVRRHQDLKYLPDRCILIASSNRLIPKPLGRANQSGPLSVLSSRRAHTKHLHRVGA